MTRACAPARRRRAAASTKRSSPSSSRLTQMRSAWNVRVAGSMRCSRGAAPRGGRSSRAGRSCRPAPRGAPRRSRARCGARSVPRRTGRSRRQDRFLARAGDQIGGGVAARAIHAHVERLVALEAEAAARRVELHRRDAEIGERAVDRADAALVEHVVDRAIVGVHQLDAIGPRRERLARDAPARRDRGRGR